MLKEPITEDWLDSLFLLEIAIKDNEYRYHYKQGGYCTTILIMCNRSTNYDVIIKQESVDSSLKEDTVLLKDYNTQLELCILFKLLTGKKLT